MGPTGAKRAWPEGVSGRCFWAPRLSISLSASCVPVGAETADRLEHQAATAATPLFVARWLDVQRSSAEPAAAEDREPPDRPRSREGLAEWAGMGETACCWNMSLPLMLQPRTLLPRGDRAHQGRPVHLVQVAPGLKVRMEAHA